MRIDSAIRFRVIRPLMQIAVRSQYSAQSILSSSLFLFALDFLRLQSPLARSTRWFRFAPPSWHDCRAQDKVMKSRNTFIVICTLRSMLFRRKSNFGMWRFDRHWVVWIAAVQVRFSHTRKSHSASVIKSTNRHDRHAQLRL